jgi:ubiquinone biosynthesis protein UbiJ
VAFSFFVNHLLDGAAWARARLAPFAGDIVEVRAAPLPALHLAVTGDGRLQPGEGEPVVVVTFTPRLQVEGDERLARELRELAKHLRWDVEEDLSKVVGDLLAHRLVEGARGFVRWQRDSAARLAEALADYAAEEAGFVVRRAELEAFAASADSLRRALDALERRIARLG